MKTRLYNFDPLKPHFYIVNLGFTGVYIIFLISAQNTDCGYSLEPPRRGGSNEYPQSMFWAEIWKISEVFIWNFLVFLEVKFSTYLHRRVFVMGTLSYAPAQMYIAWYDNATTSMNEQECNLIPHTGYFYISWTNYYSYLIFSDWRFVIRLSCYKINANSAEVFKDLN